MKTILVTGVCGGMGTAAAETLLKNGWNVIGLDRKERCEIAGVRYFQADLSDGENLKAVFQTLEEENARLDAVAHFAGIYDMNSLIEISEKDFERIFTINLFGVYRVNKTFLPLLNAGGRIVITSSELAPLDPLPFTGLYGITKGALERYAFSLRMELNLLGYRVSVIRPGAVDTGLLGDSTAALERLCSQTQLYRCNTAKFKTIVDSVESKKIPPVKIANTLLRALKARKPKFVYNVNRNALLLLLNALPDRWQVAIIGKILKPKREKKRRS